MTTPVAPLTPQRGHRRFIGPKRLVALCLYVGLAAFAWNCWRIGILTPEMIFAVTTEQPVLAPLLFVGLYAFIILFSIPSLPLNLGAGLIWGPFWGSVYSLAASVIGSVLAFLVARTALGQPLARRLDNVMLNWLMEEVEKKSWRVVAFVRINPVFPTGPINYLFGLTSLPLWAYTWATAVFLYPHCLLMANLGYYSGSLLAGPDTKRILALLFSLSAVVSAVVLSRLYLKRKRLP